ncbi:unnamed protein product, partial [Brassica oleracea]
GTEYKRICAESKREFLGPFIELLTDDLSSFFSLTFAQRKIR